MAFYICQSCGTEYEAEVPVCPSCGATETIRLNKTDRMIDRMIAGRFKIIRKLGQGGMGAVYLAEQVGIGHRVAIKFLKSEFSTDAEIARRFLNEAKSYAKVVHPNAVTFHEFGQDTDGNLFIAMEYCEGVDLKKTIAERGRLSVVEAIEVTLQVADVLADAHHKKIVHRDLKPENIMIRKGLRGIHAKVLDFGIARLMDAGTKLTVAGAIAGTPRYMSPEQVEGKEADERADIYSLGIVCFESLTGRQPFDGSTIAEIMRRQVMDPLPRLEDYFPELGIPALQAALDKACAKPREDRFPDMITFANALSQAMPTQLQMALPAMQRVATESGRMGIASSATPHPGSMSGMAVPGTLPDADVDSATLMRTPAPSNVPAGTIPQVGTGTSAAANPTATMTQPVGTHQSVPGPAGVGAISPLSAARPSSDTSPPSVPKSKAPMIAVGLGVVVLLVVGGVVVSSGTGAQTKPPPVVDVPPLRPIEPAVVAPVKVDVPVVNTANDAALTALKEQAAQSLLITGQVSFDRGELGPAKSALEKVEAGTGAEAEAKKLLSSIDTIEKSLATGDALRVKGDCPGALKAYRVAVKLNDKVPNVNSGIGKCTAAAIPENAE